MDHLFMFNPPRAHHCGAARKQPPPLVFGKCRSSLRRRERSSVLQPDAMPAPVDETDTVIAMTVSQAVLSPQLLERPSAHNDFDTRHVAQRVDFPEQEEEALDEETEGRGAATMWVKENQLMLTYFLAGELRVCVFVWRTSPLTLSCHRWTGRSRQ